MCMLRSFFNVYASICFFSILESLIRDLTSRTKMFGTLDKYQAELTISRCLSLFLGFLLGLCCGIATAIFMFTVSRICLYMY